MDMSDLRAFFECILHFFRILWASFMALFVGSLSRSPAPTSDLEAGITPHTVQVEEKLEDADAASLSAMPPNDDNPAPSPPPESNPPANEEVAKEEPRCTNQATTIDQPTRRPSRRVSFIHSVKSRVVDATLKNVQDKAIDVVKAVVITSSELDVPSCAARVEFYEVSIRPGTSSITISKKTSRQRAVQFVLPPTIVANAADNSASPSSPVVFKRHGDSIDDLFELFPYPPAHPSPASIIFPEDIAEMAPPGHNELSPSNEEASSSTEFDSLLSANISGSLLTPDSSRAPGPHFGDVLDASFSKNNDVSCGELTMEVQGQSVPVAKCLDALSHSDAGKGRLNSVPSSTTIVFYSADIDNQRVRDLDSPLLDSVCPVSDHHCSLEDSASVDTSAHVVEEGSRLSAETSNSSSANLEGARGIEFCKNLSNTSDSSVSEASDLAASPPNTPAMSVVFEVPPTPETATATLTKSSSDIEGADLSRWKQSMRDVLKAFRDAEAEDLDFRDLFYRDSSCYSQSSLAGKARDGNLASTDSSEADNDESFDSEKSVDDIPPTYDVVAVQDDHGSFSVSGIGSMLKDIVRGDSKRDSGLLPAYSSCDVVKSRDSYLWTAVSHDDERDDDLWSDLLELDEYLS
ncbi:unnamed protein product [Cyclocybe aegerita]|uniref:Uncharacterized protein n=1 Tax=Cyclocybe aegerita TaxID=1973307 RepID=A0A8S0VU03_CYCAE|nr:unnamed protein product [Cyclocybe aegerita]